MIGTRIRGAASTTRPSAELQERARRCRGAVLTMTTLADSGHPGRLLLVDGAAARRSTTSRACGPTSRGGRSATASSSATATSRPASTARSPTPGFFALEDAVAHFRQAGSPFEGHVERSVPGVEWSTGNLGQGLSAGVGFALGARLTGGGLAHVRRDERRRAEQGAGRRGAPARGEVRRSTDLTVVVDCNDAQISGPPHEIMPVDIARRTSRADGWERRRGRRARRPRAVRGAAPRRSRTGSAPRAILAHTHIGQGRLVHGATATSSTARR